MLVYNGVAVAVVIIAGAGGVMGVGLWPMIALHAVLGGRDLAVVFGGSLVRRIESGDADECMNGKGVARRTPRTVVGNWSFQEAVMMRRIVKEPLFHFLLLGVAIFAAYGMMKERASDAPEKIIISAGQVAAMAEGFSQTWRRPPTSAELDGLIRDRVREEVYCREAMALGMDKDDTIIRRRLRQKMEFLTDDVAAMAEPTDAELGAYLESHADAFRVQRRFTFSHVYLNPERHGENLARDTEQLLAQLRLAGEKADVAELGDPFLLEHRYQAVQAEEIVKQFGEKFATGLGGLSTGQWQGPVESGYGVHLVWVSERTEGRLPGLAEVREGVKREWANARRVEGNEKFYQEMLKRYVVSVERPKAADEHRVAEAKAK